MSILQQMLNPFVREFAPKNHQKLSRADIIVKPILSPIESRYCRFFRWILITLLRIIAVKHPRQFETCKLQRSSLNAKIFANFRNKLLALC